MEVIQPLGAVSSTTIRNTAIGLVGGAVVIGALIAFGRGKDKGHLSGRRSRGLRGSYEASELHLYLDNERVLHRFKESMRSAIAKKVCKGNFDAAKAAKGFRAVVDVAAKSYAKEHDSGVDRARHLFPGKLRNEVAHELTTELKRDINDCLTRGFCNDAPAELLKCPKAKPLAGRASRKGRK